MMIEGRTLEIVNKHTTAVPNAQIELTGIWRPPLSVMNSPDVPNIVSIIPPLYTDHQIGATCETGTLTPVPGDIKVLTTTAEAGATRISLSNSQNLNKNDLIQLGENDPDHTEIITVIALEGSTSQSQPTSITLSPAVAWTYKPGAQVRKINQVWNNSSLKLTVEAHKSHSCIFLNSLQDLDTANCLHILSSTGNAPGEYYQVRIFRAKSDEQGFYRLPLLQRVSQVRLYASKGGKNARVTMQPDYSLRTNQVNFVLK